jgi:protein kinase C substrate 80K-H
MKRILIRAQEPECCDGSDERSGACKDVCKEVGEAYRNKRDEQRKIQKTVSTLSRNSTYPSLDLAVQGSKIRSTYIQFAHKEKKRLEVLVEDLAQQIEVSEKEVARLKGVYP